DVAMAIEEVPRPREGRGRGLVAGKEHRHHLVSDLAVVHPSSVRLFVARVQEERQEIVVSCRALRPPPGNDRADDAIESCQRRPRTAVTWRGEDRMQKEEEEWCVQILRQCLAEDGEGVADHPGILMDVDSEERPGDDVEAETSHLVIDVDGPAEACASVPVLQEGTCSLDHERGKGGDAAPMECGLHEAPLSQPERTVARDEALAKEALQHSVVEALLGVDRVTILEHVLHVVGLPYNEDVHDHEAETHHTAVAVYERLEIAQRVSPQASQYRWNRDERRTGRKRGLRTSGLA